MPRQRLLWLAGTLLCAAFASGSSCQNTTTQRPCGGCEDGYACYGDTCVKACNAFWDCAGDELCSGGICKQVSHPDCDDDVDCDDPAECRIADAPVCRGGICVYGYTPLGLGCTDNNECTDGDVCDGRGNCVGVHRECLTPDPDTCSGNNLYTSSYPGTCVRQTGECNYSRSASVCPDCVEMCMGRCQTSKVLELKLNDASGAYWFTDASTYGHLCECSVDLVTCPTLEVPGVVSGPLVYAATFDGVDDRIVTADADEFDLTDYSITTWINIAADDSDGGYIISKQDSVSGDYLFALRLQDHAVWCEYKSGGTTEATATAELDFDTWYPLGCTYDSNTQTLSLYVGGDLVDAHVSTTATPPANTDGPLVIGANGDTTDQALAATLDDTQVCGSAILPSAFCHVAGRFWNVNDSECYDAE